MKTIFCQFLDSKDKNGDIKIKPLGLAKNKVDKPMLPGWKEVVTDIVIDKNYAEGLDGIEDYSHLIVVYWMDKEKECHLKHHPQGRSDVPLTLVSLPAAVHKDQAELPYQQLHFFQEKGI